MKMELANARIESSENTSSQNTVSTPSKQSLAALCTTSPMKSLHASGISLAEQHAAISKGHSADSETVQQPPHPHDICDLYVQGAMQVMEDGPSGSGAGKHIEYAVHVKLYCGLSYSVSRRYNVFYALDQELQRLFPSLMLPVLPPRSLFSSSILDQMDSRCAALNIYMKVPPFVFFVFQGICFQCRLIFWCRQGLVRDPLVSSTSVHKFLELNSVQQVCVPILTFSLPHIRIFFMLLLRRFSVLWTRLHIRLLKTHKYLSLFSASLMNDAA